MAVMLCSVSGPTGALVSLFLADRCGPMSEFQASLVIPAQVAHWRLPTPNTDSPSATRPTCGPSFPAGSIRRSVSTLSPKPSMSALVCVGGPAANGGGGVPNSPIRCRGQPKQSSPSVFKPAHFAVALSIL